jgi:hypothetical protein
VVEANAYCLKLQGLEEAASDEAHESLLEYKHLHHTNSGECKSAHCPEH